MLYGGKPCRDCASSVFAPTRDVMSLTIAVLYRHMQKEGHGRRRGPRKKVSTAHYRTIVSQTSPRTSRHYSLGSFQIPRIVQGDTIEHRTRTKCVSSDSQLQPHTIRVLTACRASMLCSYREWISLARLILYAVSLCSREIDPWMTEVIHTHMII